MKKTIELQANTSTPHGATIKLTVEYRSKIKELVIHFYFSIKIKIEKCTLYICNIKSQLSYETTV